MNKNLRILELLKKFPWGLWIFSRLVCWKAPYFGTIRPTFTKLEPGYGEATFKKRRAVQNHLGTVHAIAIANLCELVAGTTLEITLPSTHRWIPKSMNVNYLHKATTNVVARTSITTNTWPDADTMNVKVEVIDTVQTVVVNADIQMYVSGRPT